MILFLFFSKISFSQQTPNCENIFIITTDGFRWQELFSGADSSILFNTRFVKDTATFQYLYWAPTAEERRKKLLPFTWNFIAHKGQIWGNRNFDNCVSVANFYRMSYAGYNEFLTGYPDIRIAFNQPKNNQHSNILTYLNTLPAYKNSVVLFASWNLFSYIANGTEKKILLNCGYTSVPDDSLTVTEQLTNFIQENTMYNKLPTRADLITFNLASEYAVKKHPRIMYIGFGQTDEFAHHGEYDKYLNQANLFDKFLAELWSMTQSDNFYKNNTTIFITTDHGRGEKKIIG